MPLKHALNTLETSGLIRLAQMEPDIEYLFRHALVQEAAYESILKADRRALHRLVAETLEHEHPDQINELAATLGHHFAAGDEKDRAIQYFTLAGENAFKKYAHREAEIHFRAALEQTATESERAPLLLKLGEALDGQSRFEEAIQHWQIALPYYISIQAYDEIARLYANMGYAASDMGDTPGELEYSLTGLAAIGDVRPTPDMLRLYRGTASAYYFNGRLDEAREMGQKALEIARQINEPGIWAETLSGYAIILWADDQYTEAFETFQQALKLASETDELRLLANLHQNLGAFHENVSGEPLIAHTYFQRALDLFDRMNDVSGRIFSHLSVIGSLLAIGEFERGEVEIQTAREWLGLLDTPGKYELRLRVIEGQLLAYRGDLQAAEKCLNQCWAEATSKQDLQALGNVEVALIEVLASLGDRESLEQQFSVPDNARGIWTLSDWAWFWLSVLHARAGNIVEAHHWLEQFGQPKAPANQEFYLFAEACLAAAERRWTDALQNFEKVAERQASTGKRWYHAQTLREWAETHLARNESGDLDRARELLQEAQNEFEAMNVPKYAMLVRERLQSLDT